MSIAITLNTTTRLTARGGVHDGGDDGPDAQGGSTRAGPSLDAAGFRIAPDVLPIPAGEAVDHSFRLVDGSGATVSELS